MKRGNSWLPMIWFGAILAPLAAWAHATTTGLAQITVDDDRIRYALSLALPELPAAAVATVEAASRGEREAAESLAQQVVRSVSFELGGEKCRPGRVRILAPGPDASRARLEFELTCRKEHGTLTLREDWGNFFGDHYQTLASIRSRQGNKEVALGDALREVSLNIEQPMATGWLDFVKLGVEHILTGYDHLLFLVALLATARSLWPVVKIVTAFTVAHSVTLSLASLGVVTIPSRIIEPLIAASIVWVALENLIATDPNNRRWLLGFAFGLVHGFGFASALAELNLSGTAMARALVGFNVGVELGQVVFIAVFFPILLWLTREQRLTMAPRLASLAIAGLGGYWFIDRLLQG
jgi:hydrogenase/urease accessory protein HupE